MIAGATYKNGIALTSNGVVYVLGIASGSVVPSGSTQLKGADVPGGKCVDSDGRLCVRYV